MWSQSPASPLQFGIEDLKALPDQTGCWDGVRNYQVRALRSALGHSPGLALLSSHVQSPFFMPIIGLQARNFMRQMKEGQLAFFYHSNCKEPGIAGVMKVGQSLKQLKSFVSPQKLSLCHHSVFLNLQTMFCLNLAPNACLICRICLSRL